MSNAYYAGLVPSTYIILSQQHPQQQQQQQQVDILKSQLTIRITIKNDNKNGF